VPFTPLADAETLVRGWLATQFTSPTYRVLTETPADLGALPTIVVGRIGGSSPLITLDNARVDVTTFADITGTSPRANARSLAAQVRTALMYHLPGQVTGGGAVGSVSEESAYHFVPYDNTTLRRFEATYRITIHSIPS
jgi:hypothetical protein